MAQTKKLYFYADWGSGYVEIEAYEISLTRSIERGEFNDYAFRIKMDGSFQLIGSDYSDAYTYFITGGNYKVPFRMYENGALGTGVLKFDGWARIKGAYDFYEEKVTLSSFETNDEYTAMIPFLDTKIFGESIGGSVVNIIAFEMISEGLNAQSNLIQAFTYTAPNWTATGNTFALPYLGRVACDKMSTSIVVYDNVTRDLRKYIYTAPNWSLSSFGTTTWIQNGGNGAIAAYSNSQVAFVDDFNNELRFYQQASGTWTLLNTLAVDALQYPDLALMNSVSGRIALIDEGTKMLRGYTTTGLLVGTPYSVGDISKPSICELDSSNDKIAMVDSKTNSLRAFQYVIGTGQWTQISEPIPIGITQTPKVTQEGLNSVIVHDCVLGTMQAYTLAGTTWSTNGNSISISGGLYGTLGVESGTMAGGNIIVGSIQSDTYKQFCRPAKAYVTHVNGILNANGIYSSSDYVLNLGTNGASFDVSKTLIGNLSTLKEVYYNASAEGSDLNKYTLRQALNLAEQFQNYWYAEYDPVALGDYQIKFKQPDNFTTGAPSVDVSTYADVLEQKEYLDEFTIDREIWTWDNARNADFDGDPIEYNRNTNNEEINTVKFTTDWGYQVDYQLGNEFDFSQRGSFLVYGEDTAMGAYETLFLVEAGTGISGGTNVKNEELSKARIQDTYFKDYRYFDAGTITINGSSVTPQNTVRNLISYPDITLGLDEMPDSIGELNWGGGETSLVTAAKFNCATYQTTFESRKHDL